MGSIVQYTATCDSALVPFDTTGAPQTCLPLQEGWQYLAFCYSVLFAYAISNRMESYNNPSPPKGSTGRRRTLLQKLILPAHVFAGFGEIVLFYGSRYWTCQGTGTSAASRLALFLCITQSVTNLALVKNLRMGHPILVRPFYQAGAILRPLAMLYAVHAGTDTAYHDALVPIHAFVWARLFVALGAVTGESSALTYNANNPEVYTLAIGISALVAMHYTYSPHAPWIYMAIWIAVAMVNKWTRAQLEIDEYHKRPSTAAVRVLVFLGFCNFRRLWVAESDRKRVNTGYKIGLLPGDVVGNVIAGWGHVSIEVLEANRRNRLASGNYKQQVDVGRTRERKEPACRSPSETLLDTKEERLEMAESWSLHEHQDFVTIPLCQEVKDSRKGDELEVETSVAVQSSFDVEPLASPQQSTANFLPTTAPRPLLF